MPDNVVEFGPAVASTRGQHREVLAALQGAAAAICARVRGPDPQDVAHEAFLRLQARLDANAELNRSYLWRTAYCVTVDMIRRERSEQRRRTAAAAPAQAPDPSPEAHAQGAEIGEAISACVTTLPTDRKSVVVLHLQGHGVKEVSGLLTWDYKRVENLLHRGLKALRKCLSAKGFTP